MEQDQNDVCRCGYDTGGRSFSRQLHNEDFFYEITYPSPYHSKILWGVIREAILNFGVLIIPIVYFIIRNVILFIFGMSRFEGKAVLFLLIIVVLLIPAFSYNLTCSICRIHTVLRREYGVYHAVVSKANGLDMYITGQNGKVYKFEYCRCLGIRAKKYIIPGSFLFLFRTRYICFLIMSGHDNLKE